MAARKRKGTKDQPWGEKTRERIQTSMLVNRLTDYALGNVDPQTKKPVKMESGQVTAAIALIKKTLPDLSSVEQQVEDVTERRWIGRMPTKEEFEKKHLNGNNTTH